MLKQCHRLVKWNYSNKSSNSGQVLPYGSGGQEEEEDEDVVRYDIDPLLLMESTMTTLTSRRSYDDVDDIDENCCCCSSGTCTVWKPRSKCITVAEKIEHRSTRTLSSSSSLLRLTTAFHWTATAVQLQRLRYRFLFNSDSIWNIINCIIIIMVNVTLMCLNTLWNMNSKLLFRVILGQKRRLSRMTTATTTTTSQPKMYATLTTFLLFASTVLRLTDACSSRSTPKPRTPSPTIRPNITFPTYACPQNYATYYCLNGATCFTVEISESILYNCVCAEGYTGPRCEFKDLDGSYLPSRERIMVERASIAGGVTVAVLLIVIISIAFYIYSRRRKKERALSETDGINNHRLRPFRSHRLAQSGGIGTMMTTRQTRSIYQQDLESGIDDEENRGGGIRRDVVASSSSAPISYLQPKVGLVETSTSQYGGSGT